MPTIYVTPCGKRSETLFKYCIRSFAGLETRLRQTHFPDCQASQAGLSPATLHRIYIAKHSTYVSIGCFGNDDGDGGENVTIKTDELAFFSKVAVITDSNSL